MSRFAFQVRCSICASDQSVVTSTGTGEIECNCRCFDGMKSTFESGGGGHASLHVLLTGHRPRI